MEFRLKEFFRKLFGRKNRTTNIPSDTPLVTEKEPTVQINSEIRSRRTEDMSAESQLGIFLDRYLYDRFPNGDAFSAIKRVYEKRMQVMGIDVVFTAKDDRTYNVDEKAQLYYLNRELPTFAFELSFLRYGRISIGWLCNDFLQTDLYLLIWPFATQDSSKGITWDCFTKADCLLIEKRKLLRMLENEGLTKVKLLKDAEDIRREGRLGRISIPGTRGIYYYASDPQKYREAPINVVVSKDRLRKIAQRHYIVTPQNVIAE